MKDWIKPKKIIQKEFEITACLQNDIYMIHGLDAGKQTGIACIPDFKTSVMMNQLFRTINENDNLDALEESDDEDIYEDIRRDKFVDLQRMILMECVFDRKFRKWTPMREATPNLERYIPYINQLVVMKQPTTNHRGPSHKKYVNKNNVRSPHKHPNHHPHKQYSQTSHK